MGSRDVEEAEFVCPFAIIHAGNLDRVTCIAKLEKFYTLDDASGLDVKQGRFRFASMTLRALAETGRDLKVRNSVQQPGWSCFYAVFPCSLTITTLFRPKLFRPRPFGRTEAPSAFQNV